ncbi:hypothetical protein OSTOST_08823, partial [Ostertagia ostertagi]
MLDQALSSASDEEGRAMIEEANIIERNTEFMEGVEMGDDVDSDHKAGIPSGERAAWLRHFDINVVSPAMVIQECLPLLRKSIASGKLGTVVNISGRKGSIELCPGTERVHGNYAYMCSK